jgi:hypothetical protein
MEPLEADSDDQVTLLNEPLLINMGPAHDLGRRVHEPFDFTEAQLRAKLRMN